MCGFTKVENRQRYQRQRISTMWWLLSRTWLTMKRSSLQSQVCVLTTFLFMGWWIDPSLPPSKKKDQGFHPSFPATIRTVYRQLLRVFAHIYHAHYPQILHLRSEPHFNSFFAHFLAFGREYELLEIRDIKGEVNAPVGVGLLWERWKESGILESWKFL